MALHSISDLTTFTRNANGDVPPPLVGASTTVIQGKMYLYGGRLHSLRRMTSDIFCFDLTSASWQRVIPDSPDELTPPPRYFHSADSWNGHIVVFGGMGYASRENETLCVLSDVHLFSLAENRWLPPIHHSPPESPVDPNASFLPQQISPRPRYAHLSSISSSRLYIIGGQDMTNVWLDDIHVFDLNQNMWVERREYPRHCGTYRSVAVAGELVVRDPVREGVSTQRRPSAFANLRRTTAPVDTMLPPHAVQTQSDQLMFLPYSSEPSPDHPAEIFLYSNYNFTAVQRELEVIVPETESFTIADRSAAMSGTDLPPGLRFPTGAILGDHLIIAGTYLAQSYQSFSLWTLDLTTMVWRRIDPGTSLATGSWSRGVLWPDANRFVIFGNRDGNLVEDYNRRLLNWDHVAYVELESFGIYKPPPLRGSIDSQMSGLDAFDAEVFADFEIQCEDGRKIKCSRKLLEERWPWFKKQRINYVAAARRVVESQQRSEIELPMPSPPPEAFLISDEDRPDPRLTPRLLRLSEPYPITKAFLQYFYTQSLVTELQHAPLVLSALLLLSSIYNLPHLASLVRHAMHRTLSPATSVGVYEVATLCDAQNLQVRALRVVMSATRRSANRRGGERTDRSDRPPTREGPNGSNGYGRARARGMSDAPDRTGSSHGWASPSSHHSGGANGTNGYGRNISVNGNGVSHDPSNVDGQVDGHANGKSTDGEDDLSPIRGGDKPEDGDDEGDGGDRDWLQVPSPRQESPDSMTRGRSLSNTSHVSPVGARGPHNIREGSVTPTLSADPSPSGSGVDFQSHKIEPDITLSSDGHFTDPPRTTPPITTIPPNVLKLASASPRPVDHSKMGFGRRSRKDLPTSPALSTPSPAPTPPLKDSYFPSINFPMPPAIIFPIRAPSRKPSDVSLGTSVASSSAQYPAKAVKQSRRRSVSDVGPARPATSGSATTSSSIDTMTSIETPLDPHGYITRGEIQIYHPIIEEASPTQPLHDEIYISPARSDREGQYQYREGDGERGRERGRQEQEPPPSPHSGKPKKAWHERFLASASSSSSSKTETKQTSPRIHLFPDSNISIRSGRSPKPTRVQRLEAEGSHATIDKLTRAGLL